MNFSKFHGRSIHFIDFSSRWPTGELVYVFEFLLFVLEECIPHVIRYVLWKFNLGNLSTLIRFSGLVSNALAQTLLVWFYGDALHSFLSSQLSSHSHFPPLRLSVVCHRQESSYISRPFPDDIQAFRQKGYNSKLIRLCVVSDQTLSMTTEHHTHGKEVHCPKASQTQYCKAVTTTC